MKTWSYTYNFYNQTEILHALEGLYLMSSCYMSLCNYRRSFEPMHKWSLTAKVALMERIK